MSPVTTTMLVTTCGLLLAIPWAAPVPSEPAERTARGAAPGKTAKTDPDLGFDYRAFINDHLTLIGTGDTDKAVEHLRARTRSQMNPTTAETFKRQFALLYGGAGAFRTCDVFGYKRLGSRFCQFYAMAFFEKGTFRVMYSFEKATDEWTWVQYGFQSNLEEATKDVPLIEIDSR